MVGADGKHFHHGEPQPAHLYLKRGADGFLRQADILGVVQRTPHDIRGAIQRGEHFRCPDRVTLGFHIPPVGRRGGLLPGQRGRCHLSTGHAVVGVIQEEYRDVLTARRGMHDLRSTDGSQVAIPLVGKNHTVRKDPFDPGRHRRGASVRRLDKIQIKVVVRKNRAAYRCHTDRFFFHPHFIDHFGHQAVGGAVRAARAVMGADVRVRIRPSNKPLFLSHITIHHHNLLLTFSPRCGSTSGHAGDLLWS